MDKKAFYAVITMNNPRKLFHDAIFEDTRKLKNLCDETFELYQRKTAESAIRVVEENPYGYWLIKIHYKNQKWKQLLIGASRLNPCDFYEDDAVGLEYNESTDELYLWINHMKVYNLANIKFQKETDTLPWDFDRKEIFAPTDNLFEAVKKKVEEIANSKTKKVHYLMDRAIIELEDSEFVEVVEQHDYALTYQFGDKVTQLQLQDRIYGDGKLSNNIRLAERMVLENL